MQKISQVVHDGRATKAAKIGAMATALVSIGLIAACSDSTASKLGSSSQLGFSVATPASADVASAALDPITVGGHTLDLTAVSVTFKHAELKPSMTTVCPDDNDGEDAVLAGAAATGTASFDDGGDDHGNEECAEVKVGSATVDLSLDGKVVTVPADGIPAGTFDELEVRVVSVELKGTFDTKPFDVTIPVNAKAEIEFSTPLVVTAGQPTSITVNIPVANWLENSDGTLIDPNTISSDPNVLAFVKHQIASSLRAFEDDNHDGHDDHDGKGKNGNNQGGDGN